jgi:hypothetical protein
MIDVEIVTIRSPDKSGFSTRGFVSREKLGLHIEGRSRYLSSNILNLTFGLNLEK